MMPTITAPTIHPAEFELASIASSLAEVTIKRNEARGSGCGYD